MILIVPTLNALTIAPVLRISFSNGLAPTPEERIWLHGNCNYASIIDNFLENNDDNVDEIVGSAEFFIGLGLSQELSFSRYNSLVNAIDSYFEAPDNLVNIETLYNYFENEELNFNSTSYFFFDAGTTVPPSSYFPSGWQDMNSGDYFGRSASQRNGLISFHPEHQQYIEDNWACRVLGKSHEDASLLSLGLGLDNTEPNGSGFTKRPDGFIEQNLYENFVIHKQPVIIEMKFKGTAGDFTYLNQWPQFIGYLNYITNNSMFVNTTTQHGLFLVLPANKRPTQDIISQCSSRNIPLYYSGTEYKTGTETLLRVKYPELLNWESLNYSATLAFWFPGGLAKWALEKNLYNNFVHNNEVNINIPFDEWTAAFEPSVANQQPCPQDFEEDNE